MEYRHEGSAKPTLKEVMIELAYMKKMMSNHLKHHERYETALVIGIILMVAKQILFG
jgi:hypothetical protein